ncbi:hypothetical protein LTR97_001272 [Elasticomyces elasticus]|uniref:Uncharacterized protein n=1 Tax=Elasticomyces elasticus TaxID=574655 RepID=A0AAN7ZVV1_9PEZI|nr:hypothetical protein LTR97_001272 [Elasticomyces elasticus]
MRSKQPGWMVYHIREESPGTIAGHVRVQAADHPPLDDHNTPQSQPGTPIKASEAPSTGEKVVKWYGSVFEKGAAASAFLGGTLLSLATGGDDPKLDEVRPTAAAGATIFLILFLLCIGLPLLFEFHGKALELGLDGPKKSFWGVVRHYSLSLLSLTLQGLPLAGTACAFRVLMPSYAPAAGRVGFRVTIFLASSAGAAWLWQEVVWAYQWWTEGGTEPQDTPQNPERAGRRPSAGQSAGV